MPRPKAEKPTYSLARRGKRFYVQWWENGAAQRLSCRTEVQAKARRFLAEFRAGRDAVEPPDQPTIGEILDGYLEDRGGKVFSRTIEYDCAALKRGLADLPVDLLTDKAVESYVAERRKSGARGKPAIYRKRPRPISDGTLVRELGTLRSAFAWAVRKKWIVTAPDVERPSSPPARERWLTRDEADRLMAAAHSDHVRLFIGIALQTAARTGAILGLTWDRVDFETGTISFGVGHGRKRRSIVPISDALRPLLLEAQEAKTCEHVIEHGSKPIASIKTGVRAAVARAKLPGVTSHILRHTAASWMVQGGIPFGEVARFLGNTVQMVEKVYGHHSPEFLRGAAAVLASPVSSANGRGNKATRSRKKKRNQSAAGQD